MKQPTEKSRFLQVAAAAAVVIVLAGLLVARVWDNEVEASPAPASSVPLPAKIVVSDLEVPRWSSPKAGDWPLRFRTDLDLLAPLGTGSGNAGEYFALFEKERGVRYDDAKAFLKRRSEVDDLDFCGKVVPFDDPLLLEAEPWADQATMRHYPEIFPIEGYATRITNLLVPLAMARTWAARGVMAEDSKAGLEDCRRAIRMGRLLRQEDAILINDLVGLACIQAGAQGMFMIAQRVGLDDIAIASSIVIGEVAPQRLMSSQRMTSVDLTPFVRENEDGTYRLEAPDRIVDATIEMVTESPDMRFRGEGAMGAFALLNFGNPQQKDRAREALVELGRVPDPTYRELSRWCLSTPADSSSLAEMWLQFNR